MFGYHGNYLRIDASNGTHRREPLDSSVLRRVLGGSGLGAYLLLREDAAGLDPLDAAAPLAFVFSPLVGSPLTTSAKFAVVSKSPLTHRINDSLASSRFAIAGKMTGCDAIVIVGRASRLSVVVVEDDEVRLESAEHLSRLGCSATETKLRSQFGNGFSFAVIGEAGENEIPFATISHDGRHAGRGGSGAVLGSKNIKAIAVRGTRHPTWAEPERLVKFAKGLSDRSLGPATAKYRELGTATNLLLFNRLNSLPTENFQKGSFAGAEALSPETIATARRRTRAYCAACTIGCEHIYEIQRDGEQPAGVRIEYENLFALGPLCGVDDSAVVLEASQRCDDYGLDTISTGGTIAFAMECAERGWLDAPGLRFGDGQQLLAAIDAIATRTGIGTQLALGSRELARSLGREATEIAPQVKGLEIPGYEPRALQSMALGLAVGTRGADHNRSSAYEVDFSNKADRRHLTPDSAPLAVETENRAAILDSLIFCKFLRGVFADFYAEMAEVLQLAIGWELTPEELQVTADRIVTLKKVFNVRAGWTPAEDTLPPRLLSEPLAEDPESRLSHDDLMAAVRAYNSARGWTPEGWVLDERIHELDAADLTG